MPSTCPTTRWAFAVVLAFFVVGYAFYAALFAVAGALVPRQEEIQQTSTPITIVLFASFFLSFAALNDPGSTLARVLSFVPPSAPMVLPVRLIAGEVAAWEVALGVALLVLASAALLVVAARSTRARCWARGPRALAEALRAG
ncbi:MAG: ABC transporter permease [Actinomycetota bacterium]|nr:ABC transporter permease [Actinomycetota bacterium]